MFPEHHLHLVGSRLPVSKYMLPMLQNLDHCEQSNYNKPFSLANQLTYGEIGWQSIGLIFDRLCLRGIYHILHCHYITSFNM